MARLGFGRKGYLVAFTTAVDEQLRRSDCEYLTQRYRSFCKAVLVESTGRHRKSRTQRENETSLGRGLEFTLKNTKLMTERYGTSPANGRPRFGSGG